jgi:uncharacterized protein
MAGSVVGLWRYPVKSMMGEELNASHVGDRGLLGDRAYALVDQETGNVGSAKHPKKWPHLFDCRAVYVEPPVEGSELPPVRITLPDRDMVRSDEADVHERLSEMVGRPVRLETAAPPGASFEQYWPDIEGTSPQDHRNVVTKEAVAIAAPPGTFFDATPFHILTTATLDRLCQLYPEGRFEVRRFRPNVVVELDSQEPGFVENDWVGQTVTIGEAVRMPVLAPGPRCVMTTLPQGDLPRDPGILRTAAQHNRIDVLDLGKYPCVGVFAGFEAGGTIRRGDPVSVEA